jgi:predicted phosphodiesterase
MGFFMPLRLRIISDLHLEFHQDGGQSLLASMNFESLDALVVAGDLCGAKAVASSFDLICNAFQGPIIYVPGNHEYYGSSTTVPLLNFSEQKKPSSGRGNPEKQA